jgi:hypothetical protein
MMKVVSPLDLLDGQRRIGATQAGTFRTPKTASLGSHRCLPGGRHEHHPRKNLRRQHADKSSVRNSSPRRHTAPARDLRSFVQQAGAQSGDDGANGDSLLLNQQQYSELANGRPSEAPFSAAATHAQEVNLGLPVSAAEPQEYLPAVRQQLPRRRQENRASKLYRGFLDRIFC